MNALERYNSSSMSRSSGQSIQAAVGGGIRRVVMYGATKQAVKYAVLNGKDLASDQTIGMLKTFAVGATVGSAMMDDGLLAMGLDIGADIAAVIAASAEGMKEGLAEQMEASASKTTEE